MIAPADSSDSGPPPGNARSLIVDPPQNRSGNSIGFLRLLFAAMVIYSHAHLLGGFPPERLLGWTHGNAFAGGIGVQCFFVLSGFLVATSYRRLQSPLRFLWHRALRLVPGCWLCLVFTALVLAPLLYVTSPHATGFFHQNPSPLGYVWHNLLLPRRQIGIGELIGDNPWGADLNGSLWTLFYEGACYLFVIGIGVAGLLGRGRIVWLALWAGAVAGCIFFVGGATRGVLTSLYDTPGKLLCLHFASGITWAVFPELAALLERRLWWPLLAGAGLLVSWHAGFGNFASPLLLPIILFALITRLPLRNWERKLGGDYSYGLYVFGYPIEQTLAHFQVQRTGFVVYFLAAGVLALLLAMLSWHFIESPALRLKRWFDPLRQPAADPVAAG